MVQEEKKWSTTFQNLRRICNNTREIEFPTPQQALQSDFEGCVKCLESRNKHFEFWENPTFENRFFRSLRTTCKRPLDRAPLVTL